ncbi:unnamed protein product [Cuscuta europaea]|uniref:Uncharacterized protein n=1 Tax=Cuscuta europaea TaxID=41803 RepID=A0A9P0YR65_CUSEU|nr:unnamed protein product [Cuscuta europaea]
MGFSSASGLCVYLVHCWKLAGFSFGQPSALVSSYGEGLGGRGLYDGEQSVQGSSRRLKVDFPAMCSEIWRLRYRGGLPCSWGVCGHEFLALVVCVALVASLGRR